MKKTLLSEFKRFEESGGNYQPELIEVRTSQLKPGQIVADIQFWNQIPVILKFIGIDRDGVKEFERICGHELYGIIDGVILFVDADDWYILSE